MIIAELSLKSQRGLAWSGKVREQVQDKEDGMGMRSMSSELRSANILPVDIPMEKLEEYVYGHVRDRGSGEDSYPYKVRLWLLVEEEPIGP